MTIKAFRQNFNKSLASVYPTVEIDSLFFQLMEHVLNIGRAEIILNINTELNQDVENDVVQFMNRLEKKEPIQYIIGQTSFAGIPIHLNHHVLIPRPETESLVYWIKSREPDDLAILDICSGSGCIAFALENHINARVTAWDISNKALTVAKQTACLDRFKCQLFASRYSKTDSNPRSMGRHCVKPTLCFGGGEATNSRKCT